MRIPAKIMVALLAAVTSSVAVAQAGPCSQALCIAKRAKIDAVCHGVGGLVYFEDGNEGMCYCKCSCLNASALVQVDSTNYQQIAKLNPGDDVISFSKQGTMAKAKVSYSDGSTIFNEPVYYSIFIRLSDDQGSFVATPDHLFMDTEERFIRADRIQRGMRLKGADGNAVEIEDAFAGQFEGPFHHIGIGEKPANFDDVVDI